MYCMLFKISRYPGVTDDDTMKKVIEKGTKSIEFIELVSWLSKQLQALNDLESCVNVVTGMNSLFGNMIWFYYTA